MIYTESIIDEGLLSKMKDYMKSPSKSKIPSSFRKIFKDLKSDFEIVKKTFNNPNEALKSDNVIMYWNNVPVFSFSKKGSDWNYSIDDLTVNEFGNDNLDRWADTFNKTSGQITKSDLSKKLNDILVNAKDRRSKIEFGVLS